MVGLYKGDKVLKDYKWNRKVNGGKESGNAWKICKASGILVYVIDPGFHPDLVQLYGISVSRPNLLPRTGAN